MNANAAFVLSLKAAAAGRADKQDAKQMKAFPTCVGGGAQPSSEVMSSSPGWILWALTSDCCSFFDPKM